MPTAAEIAQRVAREQAEGTHEQQEHQEASSTLKSKFASFQPPEQLVPKEEKEERPDPTQDAPEHYEGREKEEREEGRPEGTYRAPKKVSFVKKKEQEASEAVKRSQELQSQLEESEKTKKELQEKLEALQANSDNATTAKQYEEAQKRIAEVEVELNNEKERAKHLESRVEFYDLRESPSFRANYVEPVIAKAQEIGTYIGPNNHEGQQAYAQILNANAAVMQAPAEERARFEEIRDELLSNFIDSFPQKFKQERLYKMFSDFFEKTEAQTEALRNWEPTRQRLIEQAQEEGRKAEQRHSQYWGNLYDETAREIDESLPIDAEIKKLIADNHIEYSEEDSKIARDLIKLKSPVSEKDTVRILNQGRAYPVAVAAIKALKIQLKQQADLIAKLRGSDPGHTGSGGETKPATQANQGFSLTQKIAKHQMS